MENHLEKLKKLLSEKFGVPADQITQSSDLSGDFNLSNLEVNDLLVLVRNEFELIIPPENEIEKIKSVADIISFIDTYSQDL